MSTPAAPPPPAAPSAPAPDEILRAAIRSIPDWPEPGVMFRDITPLLADARALRVLGDVLAQRWLGARIDHVVAIEARGLIVGALLARELNCGMIPLRKKGKLPHHTLAEPYALEYGQAVLEVHADACTAGERVLLVDDLIATGGTMLAGARLLRRLGAEVVECAAIVDLPDLGGSAKLRADGLAVHALLEFPGH